MSNEQLPDSPAHESNPEKKGEGILGAFQQLPWWFRVLSALGIAPILIWPRVLEHAVPQIPAAVVISDIICVYPVFIPICLAAAFMLHKQNHRTLSIFFLALLLALGVFVMVIYWYQASAK